MRRITKATLLIDPTIAATPVAFLYVTLQDGARLRTAAAFPFAVTALRLDALRGRTDVSVGKGGANFTMVGGASSFQLTGWSCIVAASVAWLVALTAADC